MERRKSGFTLIEIIVVVALVAIVGVVASIDLSGANRGNQVDSVANEITTAARRAQNGAMGGQGGGEWGVHFANPSNGQPFFAVFNGATYSATSTQGVTPLPAGVAYLTSSVPSGGTLDVTFNPVSGNSSQSTTIGVYAVASPSYVKDIYISSVGLVTYGTSTNVVNQSYNGNSKIMWVSDFNNNRVQEFNSSGTYIGQIGCGGSGGCAGSSANGSFYGPMGIAFNSSGVMFVADYSNNRVQEFSPTGTYIGQIGCGGSGGCSASSANGSFNGPNGVAIDANGNVWVVDQNDNRVEEFNPAGTYITQVGCPSGGCSATSANGGFASPFGVTVDPVTGNLWVGDWTNNRLEQVTPTGTYVNQAGCGGSGGCPDNPADGYFASCVEGITIDSKGNVWVGDGTSNNRIQEFSKAGAYEGQLGCANGGCGASSANGLFNFGTDVAIDSNGNFWAVDQYNDRVQEFTPLNTYLGQIGCGGSGGCAASSSNGYFALPTYIVIH